VDVVALLVLQLATALLTLVFGAQAVRVARRSGRNRDRALAAWEPTGFAFTLAGALLLVHAVWAAAAIRAGGGTAGMRRFMDWAPALNTGRGLLSVAYAAVLAAHLAGRRRWVLRLSARSLPVFAGAAVAGTVAARLLDRDVDGLTQLAVLSTITVVLLLSALLMAVINDGLDQLLWFSLAAYTLKETMQVSMLAIIAWWTPGSPMAVTHGFYVLNALTLVVMIALAWRRLRMVAEEQHVPALFEHIHARRRSSPA